MSRYKDFLEEPYRTAWKRGATIDYEVGKGLPDHEYIKSLGYSIHSNPDCSCSAHGLPGISLSSYGDWGSIYVDELSPKSKKIALDLLERKIAVPLRLRDYIGTPGEGVTYEYEEEDGWSCKDRKVGGWHECEIPEEYAASER